MESHAVWNRQQNSRQVLAVFEEAIKNPSYRWFSFSFCCFWIWFWAVSRSSLLFPRSVADVASLFRLLPVLVGAVTFVALGLWFRRRPFLVGTKRGVYVSYIAMSIGCGICVLSTQGLLSLDLTVLCYIAGSVVMGVAAVFVQIEYARVLGVMGSQRALVQIVLSTLESVLIVALLGVAPPVLAEACVVVLPLLGLFAFLQARKALITAQVLKHGFDHELLLPWRLLVTLFSQGVAVEAFRFALASSYMSYGSLNAICTVASIVAIVVTSLFFRLNYNNLIYHVGFVAMASGFLLIACLPGYAALGAFLILTGSRYVNFLAWSLFAYFIKNKGLPATWVLAWPTAFLLLGMYTGGLISDTLARTGLPSHTPVLAMILSFALLVVALFMLSSRNLLTGWGMVHPGASDLASDSLAEVRQQLAEYYDLTNREGEILACIARGRNSAHIAEELGISYATVKTHLRNIYDKTGVHSKQELMSIIEHETLVLQGEHA
ncbi:MAG: helix-turn-helix transcriptional regulator [Coriobacteriia bacterium]|nr:helix-turn-helix transcriptional regulator [Coriobacteriia bacterium]